MGSKEQWSTGEPTDGWRPAPLPERKHLSEASDCTDEPARLESDVSLLRPPPPPKKEETTRDILRKLWGATYYGLTFD